MYEADSGYLLLSPTTTPITDMVMVRQVPHAAEEDNPMVGVSSCLQVRPIPVVSVWRSPRQVFLVRPHFLFPWVFHLKVCLVMHGVGCPSVCPIHPRLLTASLYSGSFCICFRVRNSSLEVCWARCPAWCSVVGSILL